MADSSSKIRAKLSALNDSLDELETQLEPLLAQSLPETLLGLDNIQQAKLQVMVPYLVYDLVFIYLKTRGIDPKTHKVIQELDRIRQYFDKIKDAEDPAKLKMTLDKGAANRFIKHAIASITTQRPPGQDEGMTREQLGEGSSKDIPIKMTSKMIARAQYEKELKEAGSEEEDELEVFDEGNDDMEVDGDRGDTSDKGKGKGRASDIDCGAEGVRKRRRVAMDPFDGYEDKISATSTQDAPSENRPTTDVRSKIDTPGNVDSGRSTPMSSSEPSSQGKKPKKKKKKNRKGSKAV